MRKNTISAGCMVKDSNRTTLVIAAKSAMLANIRPMATMVFENVGIVFGLLKNHCIIAAV